MEFKAESLDLDLELTTLTGEKVELKPKSVMNSTKAIEVTNSWTELEKDEDLNPLELIATELSFIYPKSKKWFMDNFDPATLNKILIHVAETIGGIKKKEEDSKQS